MAPVNARSWFLGQSEVVAGELVHLSCSYPELTTSMVRRQNARDDPDRPCFSAHTDSQSSASGNENLLHSLFFALIASRSSARWITGVIPSGG